MVGGRRQENRRGREKIVAIPGSAGLILNCGAGDIKWEQLGRRWAAEPGQRARLPVSLHSGLLARLPVSRRSGLLARLPSTHKLSLTAPADEKRDSWRHVNANGFNSESIRLNVTGLCSKIPWLFICATSHKHLSN